MNSKNYISNALRTESIDFEAFKERLSDERILRLLHAALGKCTEAGEFLDALKKYIVYGKDLDLVNLREEIGDGHWYDAIAASALETTFEEIWEKNIAKLKSRYGDKFNQEGALNRDLEKERDILNNGRTNTINDYGKHEFEKSPFGEWCFICKDTRKAHEQ